MASATSTYAKIVHVVDSFSVNNNKSITPTVLDCHLHGWQWHCMSVLREMKVLQTLVQQTNDDNDDDDKTKQSPPASICIHQFGRLRYRFKCVRIASSRIEIIFPVACDQIQSDSSRQGESRSVWTYPHGSCGVCQSQLIQKGQLMLLHTYVVCDSWCKMRVELRCDFFANELSRMQAVPCYEFSNCILTIISSSILFTDRYIGKNRSSQTNWRRLGPCRYYHITPWSLSLLPYQIGHKDG